MSTPWGAVFFKASLDFAGLVIDAGVETQLVNHPVALGAPAGNADEAAAFYFGNLANSLADRTRRSRDDDGFAGLRLAHVQQAEVAGHAGHAEHIEPGCQYQLRADLEDAAAPDVLLRNQTIFLDIEAGIEKISDGKRRIPRRDYLTDAAGAMTAPISTGAM